MNVLAGAPRRDGPLSHSIKVQCPVFFQKKSKKNKNRWRGWRHRQAPAWRAAHGSQHGPIDFVVASGMRRALRLLSWLWKHCPICRLSPISIHTNRRTDSFVLLCAPGETGRTSTIVIVLHEMISFSAMPSKQLQFLVDAHARASAPSVPWIHKLELAQHSVAVAVVARRHLPSLRPPSCRQHQKAKAMVLTSWRSTWCQRDKLGRHGAF
jgi:hypothetical protein